MILKKYFILFLVFSSQIIVAQTIYPTLGKITRNDIAFDDLIDKDAKIEVLASGFDWSEGPVWIKDGGFLLFSDVPRNQILKWKEGEGISVWLQPSGYTGISNYSHEPGSNGLTLNKKNELVLCEHGDRRISVMPLNGGGKRTVADNYLGQRFNSPNDAVVSSKGIIYFTDPPYGLPKQENDPLRESKVFGVYKIAADGKVSLIVSDLERPNGIALSPDEKTLYVAQSDPKKAIIMRYVVNDDGSIGKGKMFFDTTPWAQSLPGLPDGLRVDKKGNVFATGPGGVNIFSSTGKWLGRVHTGLSTSNCAFGDDGSSLYMTVDMYLCRVKTKTTGLGF